MTQEKFQGEVKTLEKFFIKFCENKHENQFTKDYILYYMNEEYNVKVHLCEECQELISYSFDRLKQCPHEIKPRCRRCPNPCYEKKQWKQLAKLMKYSGFQLGLTKIKKIFKK